MVLRVVIAEDSLLMREGIMSVLALSEEIEVVDSCEDYHSLLASVAEHDPDVVVTDIRMPPTQTDEGIRAASEIRANSPDIGVVVLSQYIEPDYAMRLFEEGSDGRAYLLKERVGHVEELSRAVDPKVVDALIDAHASRSTSLLDRLTKREGEVLAEIAKGGTNAAVGEALFISSRSVEKHVNSIFMKLDLSHETDTNRRVRAVLLYLADTNT